GGGGKRVGSGLGGRGGCWTRRIGERQSDEGGEDSGLHGRAQRRTSGNAAQIKEKNMETRLNYAKVQPGAYKAMLHLHEYLTHCGLEPSLLDLVYLRASQINGCAFCVDMDTQAARLRGGAEQALCRAGARPERPA